MADQRRALKRYECSQHGDTLTVADEAGRRFCVPHARYVEPVEVEYMSADQLRGAVDLLREAAPLVTNPYAPRDAVAAWIARYREIVEPSTDSGAQ